MTEQEYWQMQKQEDRAWWRRAAVDTLKVFAWLALAVVVASLL